MARVYNFSAGPAVLPEEVLREAADEMLDYKGSGQSVMEMSHRSKVYDNIIKEAEADLRDLLNIPDGYYNLYLRRCSDPLGATILDYKSSGVLYKNMEIRISDGKVNILRYNDVINYNRGNYNKL